MNSTKDIKQALDAEITANQLTLGLAYQQPPQMKSVIRQATGKQKLVIADPSPPLDDGETVQVSGKVQWWGNSADVEAFFWPVENEMAMRLEIKPSVVSWDFDSEFPTLARALKQPSVFGSDRKDLFSQIKFASPEFIIASTRTVDEETAQPIWPGLNLKADVELTGHLTLLSPLLGGGKTPKAVGPIKLAYGDHSPVHNGIPLGTELIIPIENADLLGLSFTKAIALLEFDTVTAIDRNSGETNIISTSTASLQARTKIGNEEVDVQVILPASNEDPASIEFIVGESTPDLSALASTGLGNHNDLLPNTMPVGKIGITELRADFLGTHPVFVSTTVRAKPGGKAGWAFLSPLTDSLRLEDIGARCEIVQPLDSKDRLIRTRIDTEFRIDDMWFDVAIRWPSGAITCTLREGTGQVSDLVKHFKPNATKLPKLTMSEAAFETNLDHSFLNFFITSDEIWHVPSPGNSLAVEDVSFELKLNRSSAGKTTIGVELSGIFQLGDALFTLTAQHPEDGNIWLLEGEQAADETLNLKPLLESLTEEFGLDLPEVIPELSIKNLDIRLEVDGKKGVRSIGIRGETDAHGNMPLGTKQYDLKTTVDLLIIKSNETGKFEFSGYIEAMLPIGNQGGQFDISYEMGKENHFFEADYDAGANNATLSISDIAGLLGIAAPGKVPNGAEFELQEASFQYDVAKKAFMLAAQNRAGEDAFVVASHEDDDWGLVFGLDYSTPGPSTPVVGDHWSDVTEILAIRSLAMVISTADVSSFRIPTLPSLRPPRRGTPARLHLAKNSVAGATTVTSNIGSSALSLEKDSLSIAFVSDPGKSDNVVVQALGKTIGDGEFCFQFTANAAKGGFDLRAFADSGAKLSSKDGSQLKIGNPVVQLGYNGSNVSAQIIGSLLIHLEDKLFEAKGRLIVTPEELEGTFEVQADQGDLLTLPGVRGVHFNEFGVEAGVEFEPPALDFGLEGEFQLGPFNPPLLNRFAFVLEMIEELPNPQLFSVALAEIDLPTALAAFDDRAHTNIPGFLNNISATDVSFYWAESPVALPDGTIAQPGLGFNGFVDLFGLKAHARLKVDTGGISGDAEMDPVHFSGVVDITGKGKGVNGKEVFDTQTNSWVRATRTDLTKSKPGPKTRTVTLVSPGGPELRIGTSKSPFISASWHVSLFGLLSEEFDVEVTDKGADFHLKLAIAHFMHAGFDCVISKKGFSAKAHFDIGFDEHIGPIVIPVVDVDLGTIHLVTKLDVDFGVTIDKDSFECELEAEFDFEGLRFGIPKFTIHVPFSSFEDLPKIFLDEILDNAGKIFEALVKDIGHLLEEGAKEVGHLAVEAGKEIEKIAEETGKEVVALAQSAEKVVTLAAAEVANEAKVIAADVVKFEKQTVQAIKDVASDVEHEVVKLEHEAEKVVSEAAAEVVKIAHAVEYDLEVIGQEIVKIEHEVEQEIVEIAHEAEVFAANVIHEAEKVFNSIIGEARRVVSAIERQVTEIFNDIANIAKKVGHAIVSGAKKVFSALSHY